MAEILRELWQSRMGKFVIVSGTIWSAALTVAICLKNLDAVIYLIPVAAGLAGIALCCGYREAVRETKEQWGKKAKES